jgi:hypothetical protein
MGDSSKIYIIYIHITESIVLLVYIYFFFFEICIYSTIVYVLIYSF